VLSPAGPSETGSAAALRPAVLTRRGVALLVLAAGLIAAAAGVAGLALTRHPVPRQWGAAPTLPAPTGPIAAAPQRRPAPVSPPVALTIPAIGVQTTLVRLGLTAAGALQVPSSTAVAGWFTGSPRPGAVGPAVIAGHIDSRAGPGVFYRLSALRPGDEVYVRRADGTLAAFRVTAVHQYPKDDFPTGAVYGATPDAELRLITCGGTFDYATGSYLSNTVVYAVEAG
jgi:LPXTG-site transpeptidase (sortase) family protein